MSKKDVVVKPNKLSIEPLDEVMNKESMYTVIHKSSVDHFTFPSTRKNLHANLRVILKSHRAKIDSPFEPSTNYLLVENDDGKVEVTTIYERKDAEGDER